MRSEGTKIELGRRRTPEKAQSRRGAPLALFYAVFTLLLGTNVLTGLALYYAPEIQSLFREDNTAILTAYEQRIVQLRLEVDRLHSRQFAQMGDMNLQMHELVQQQDVLLEQHEYVRALAEMAREMGIAARPASSSTDPVITGSIGGPLSEGTGDASQIASNLLAMQEETRLALAALSDAASLSTQEIVSQLRDIGIHPAMPEGPAMGGPFIPAGNTRELSIIDEANAVATALTQFQSAREALLRAPVQRPVANGMAISSGFGNRTDPFLKRVAFHAGIDFRAPTGTPILAAATGKVVFSGTNGGYGKMVDIDHGNGLVTRYAHMSAIAVHEGQSVQGGQRIGNAGSTGRSTGPHLHFEVRRNDTAVDPSRFLAAGRALTKFF